MYRLVMENRSIELVYDPGNNRGYERHQVLAWLFDDDAGGPPIPLIADPETPSMMMAPEGGYVRMEVTRTSTHIPVMVHGQIAPSVVRCPQKNDHYIDVEEAKVWRVALAFGDGRELSQRRWVEAGFDWAEIDGIIRLFAEAGLCTEPRRRHTTQWLPNVTRDHVIAFVSRITTGLPHRARVTEVS